MANKTHLLVFDDAPQLAVAVRLGREILLANGIAPSFTVGFVDLMPERVIEEWSLEHMSDVLRNYVTAQMN